MDEFVTKEIARIRALVGEKGQVIGAFSHICKDSTVLKLARRCFWGSRFYGLSLIMN